MSGRVDKDIIKNLAFDQGFDDCRFAQAQLPEDIGKSLQKFISKNFHGQMNWLEETFERRLSPEKMWLQAKTAIILVMNYAPQHDPLAIIEKPECGAVSVYAQNRDYHDVIKGKLKTIAGQIAAKSGKQVKVFVDTAPLMEKPLAMQSGLGWQGKHTNLVSRVLGSWFFIGVILSELELDADEMEKDHCGSCSACLDACPTGAFPKPYQIDARRCISYLTIEHKSAIPVELRPMMGNRIYGCDDCLAACPWNKYAQAASEAKFKARDDLIAPKLAELIKLNDTTFRQKFSGSPIKRIGVTRFLRNVLIAIGNSNESELAGDVLAFLENDSLLLRGAAIWALSCLMKDEDFITLYRQYGSDENNADLQEEWRLALSNVNEANR